MERRPELDSLRGLAALSVVTYHALALNSDQLTAGVNLEPVDGALANLLVYSPLHVFWLGAEAVWLFFVLSGFVLTRSTMNSSFQWGSYYPSRMIRLYLPVIFAVGLAALTYLIPHDPAAVDDPLLPIAYPLPALLSDVTLLGGTTTSLGVLWSLQWEVVFSLLLPVYVLLSRRYPRLTLLAAFALMTAGWMTGVPAASFLPMFFFGAVLAVQWPRVEAAVDRIRGTRRAVVGVLAMAVGVLAITSFYLLGPAIAGAGLPPRPFTVPLVLVGVVVIVVLAMSWNPLRLVLRTRPLVFLGRISFSIYLVHLPIVVLFVFIVPNHALALVLGISCALAMSVAFYFLVEQRAHRLARRVGRSLAVEPKEEAHNSPVPQQAAEQPRD